MRGVNVKDVKENNKAILYECVRKNGPLTLADLEQLTNLSRPTVTSLIRELEDENRILRIGHNYSNVGRAPVLYGINPDVFYAVGIDFEFPICRIAISNLAGKKIASVKRKYTMNTCAEDTIHLLMQQIEQAIAESGVNKEQFLGIGLGMPGVINQAQRRSLIFERISDWKDIPVGEILSKRFEMPVLIENDVHTLVRAERRLWHREEFSNLLFISIRSGIGMSVVMNGQSLNGENGNAGFLGHMVVNTEGPRCTCGKYGCLEMYASELSMLKMYKSWTNEDLESIAALAERAYDGDIAACRVLEYAGYYLGIGIGNAALLFDISRIVINAQFDTQIILRKAQATLNENINQYRKEGQITLYSGRLEEKDFALGGCLMAIESMGDYEKSRLI